MSVERTEKVLKVKGQGRQSFASQNLVNTIYF